MGFVPEKCLNCCWARFLGDRIFCPFTACEKDNRTFKNCMYNGGKGVKQIGGVKVLMVKVDKK